MGLDPIVFGPRGEPVKCRNCGGYIRPVTPRPGEAVWCHLSGRGDCWEGAQPPALDSTSNRRLPSEAPVITGGSQ